MEDKEIIEKFFARDEQAIAAIEDKYGKLCRRVSHNILKDYEDVDECLNDTWLSVWNNIPPERPHSLMAYVAKITKNLSLKKYRDNSGRHKVSEFFMSLDEIVECIPDQQIDDDATGDDELREIIEKFMDTLSVQNRVIFMKRYWYEDSLQDIAEAMGLSYSSVSVRLHRIRKQLKKFLEKENIVL